MPKITKETLERIIREVYGLEIPDERLNAISRIITQTLEALEKASTVDLEGLEPTSTT
jgi:Asp-tRNA(Asn)/Glu-tRNA(Gln) amidotransferase C subunit